MVNSKYPGLVKKLFCSITKSKTSSKGFDKYLVDCNAWRTSFGQSLKCLFVLIVNYIGMNDYNVNKTNSCSSSEEFSSLLCNLRVLIRYVNYLEFEKCPESRTTKPLQVPDFIAFEISSRYC